jgi:hypothetical protein
MPRLDDLPCPLCGRSLEPAPGKHGVVWLCRGCRAGAATLPILRQVAPRVFVNHLWQAALHHGRSSRLVCPSCAEPFTQLVPAGTRLDPGQLEVCVRCHWVWLNPRVLSSLSAGAGDDGRLLVDESAVRAPAVAPREARRLLGSLAAGVVRRVLLEPPGKTSPRSSK